jgi:excisionase family DNA binding protein
MTTHEVAEMLGVSKATVLRWKESGRLPAYQLASNVTRFDEADVRTWLAGKRTRTLAVVPDGRSDVDAR